MTLALTGVILLAGVFILLPSFSNTEVRETNLDVESIVSLLQVKSGELERSVKAWSTWDDMYTYVQDRNSHFAQTNLVDSTFKNLHMNMLVILTNDKKVVYTRGFDLNKSAEEAIPQDLLNQLIHTDALLEHGVLNKVVSGFFSNQGQVWILASGPVIPNTHNYPVLGTLIFGRKLDESEVASIANVSHHSVQIFPYSFPNLPPDFLWARSKLTGSVQYANQLLGSDRIAGYTLYPGIDQKPALIVRLVNGRGIFNEGMQSILLFVLSLLGFGGLFAAFIAVSLDREVISRLEILYAGFQKIREEKDLSVRMDMPGDDEFAALAKGINDTMEALENSELALKKNQDLLAYEASHDLLTGFANRAFFIKRLNQAINFTRTRPEIHAAVLFADLDGFKLINDSYDHQVGDKMLIAFGEMLTKCVRDNDFVARLGGDEFAILVENIHSQDIAIQIAERMLSEVKKPFDIEGHALFMSVSIGIALTKKLITAEELLRNADMAMYRAKENGKACFSIFDETMHSQAIHRLTLETELRQAAEQGEFTIYYQPIVSMFDGEVTSLEALIRWQHPTRGLVLPDDFLPVAKETGLIDQINVFLFHTVFAQLKEWREAGLTHLRVALNVTAQALVNEPFWVLLQKEFDETGVPPSAIQIEVVESEMAASIDQTMEALERLEKMGVMISVDDFGTGYSSLAYLKRLPIHSLKIDRTFIKDVIQDRDGAAIVSAMIVMAHVLGLDVVAEGVETESQFRFLLDQSCEKAQGYLLSHPENATIITELLLSGRALLPESEAE